LSEKKKEEKYIPFVGLVDDYVGRSAWDFYSWGHMDIGIAAFLVFSLTITIPEFMYGRGASIIAWWMVFLFTFLVAILWELLENTLIYHWGWRQRGKDSWMNALWDIIFVTAAGAVMWLFEFLIRELWGYFTRWFYIVGAISFFIILICYVVGFYITNEITKKSRKARK